ncbi:ShlB/FhaC/HecB family hemolysin secretion/activation protein [Polynucleobacter sp. UK-Kesae-W10]|uniref:ShlB/FhaC/HecB family hemolysin secretion/activation protein n=1 Tax=Polynucleobacter sp. UK-Kesae-W10 TaxID=1819738 RepID=UPI001C0B74B8|nr:ShlB/FhaC/HecB family hemolysin secretion/activation protein [Polynucleobacter sp. UK-Kesae-W10]
MPLAAGLMHAQAIWAQAPDAGALQQQLQREVDQNRPSQAPAPLVKKAPSPSKPAASKETLEVKKFVVSGATLISPDQIAQTLAPFENRELSFDQIREAANAVTALYTKIGRTAQAVIPPQDVVGGVIKINILEGKVGKVIIDLDKTAPSRLKSSVIQEFISDNNPDGAFIDLNGLERSMALLNELPGNESAAELLAGDKEESTNISVSAKDTGFFTGRIDASNYGSPSTGAAQAVASLNLNNLSGIGDQVSLDAIGSQGSIYGTLKYGLPIGSNGWRLSVGVSALDYKSIPSFSPTVSQGNAQTYGLYGTYALERSATSTTNFVVNYENKNYNNSTNGSETSRYQLNNVTAGFNGTKNFGEQFVNWGVNAIVGTLNIGNTNQYNNDQAGAATNGTFTKLSFNGALTSALPIDRTTAIVSIYGQLANKNLNTAEQLYLGGPYGVRAYPVAQGGGAQGAVASVEVMHSLPNQLQVGAFVDAGVIQQYITTWTGWQGQTNAGNTYPLYAAGPIAKYNYDKLQLIASLAFRVGNNPLYNSSGQQINVDNYYRTVQGWIKGTYFF